MGVIKNYFHEEIEMRAMFDQDSDVPKTEAFEILESNDIKEITWDNQLNQEYANWQYLNIK